MNAHERCEWGRFGNWWFVASIEVVIKSKNDEVEVILGDLEMKAEDWERNLMICWSWLDKYWRILDDQVRKGVNLARNLMIKFESWNFRQSSWRVETKNQGRNQAIINCRIKLHVLTHSVPLNPSCNEFMKFAEKPPVSHNVNYNSKAPQPLLS
jgi:hypothetical protein